MYTPSVAQELVTGDARYRFAEHPGAPGMPYGQEGRQAVVYLLDGEDASRHALKVFKPRYRVPSLVSLSDALRDLASLPGLRVADRLVLSSLKHAALLAQSPDLTYATLMPWIDGPTWMQVLLDKRDLTRQESLQIARSFASLLVRLEERGIAHCDLSASNVMLPTLAGAEHAPASEIELVDVEQLYAPGLPRSQFVSSGSPGYAHPHVPAGLWGPAADRFAGAILLAEMLCWSERQVRDAAWGESYFDPSELQADSARYRLLERAVRTLGGQQAAALLQRAWQADTLEGCPTFGEWLVALPTVAPQHEVVLRDGPGADPARNMAGSAMCPTEAPPAEGIPDPLDRQEAAVPGGPRVAVPERPKAPLHGPAHSQPSYGTTILRQSIEAARERSQHTPKERAGQKRRLAIVAIAAVALLVSVALFVILPLSHQEQATTIPVFAGVLSVAFSPDGETLAAGLMDGTAKLFSVKHREQVATLTWGPNPRGEVRCVAYGPSGVLAACAEGGMFAVWTDGGRSGRSGRPFFCGDGRSSLMALALAADGSLAVARYDGVVCRIDPQGFALGDFAAASPVNGLAYSPDSCSLALVSGDGTVTLADADNGNSFWTVKGPEANQVAFSPDGAELAVVSRDQVSIYDVRSSALIRVLQGDANTVLYSVAYSPDGRTIASGTTDGAIRLWNAATGGEMSPRLGHSSTVFSVAFSPDGRLVASGSFDQTIRVWPAPKSLT